MLQSNLSGNRAVHPPPPLFFVGVASKGFSFPTNPFQSTLMGMLVSVASKGLVAGGIG
jgi:hypothetical protein